MGYDDRFSNVKLTSVGGAHYIDFPESPAPSGNPNTNRGWLYVKDNGGESCLYFESDAGTVTSLVSPTVSTAWDDLTSPDANKTLAFTTFTSTMTSTSTAADCFTIKGLGNFGDISVLRVEQSTGNPTDGTVLEVVSADANVDALLVTSGGIDAIKVDGAGAVTMAGSLVVTGTMTAGALVQNAVSAAAATILTLDGGTTGGVNIGSVSTGDITLGSNVIVADGKNFLVGEGSLTVDNDVNESAVVITASTTTTGSALEIVSGTTTSKVVSITADDLGAAGVMLNLDTDNIATNNFYVACYNGTTNEFTISRYGATVIAGVASTDMLTLTLGDLQITDGDIDVDNGQLMVDTAQDLASNVTRNYNGVGTAPVLTVKDDHTATTNVALHVESDGTGAATCLKCVHDGTGPIIDLSAGAARNGDAIVIAMANMLDERALYISGAITSAANEGVIEVQATGACAVNGSLLRLDWDTGTPAGATEGFMINVDDDSIAAATSYAVKIDSANNEALHVATGKALFDEEATFTGGVNIDGGMDIDFSANTEKMSVESTQVDLAAGDAWVTIHGDHAGNTNDAALLRLVYQADADAQDTFILCEDNSTGAAGNGDDMFKVAAGGVVTAAGLISAGAGMTPGATAGTAATLSVLNVATVAVSNAALKALNAAPLSLVASPGAGKWLELDSVVFVMNATADPFDAPDAAANLMVRYTTSNVSAITAIETSGLIDAASDTVAIAPAIALTTALSNVVNDGFELFNQAAVEYTGSADGTATVIIRYWIHDDTV